jgi:hypothetical protein
VVAAARLEFVQLIAFADAVPACPHVAPPSLERSILNPCSVELVSTQLSRIEDALMGVALSPCGAAGGGNVVACVVFEGSLFTVPS